MSAFNSSVGNASVFPISSEDTWTLRGFPSITMHVSYVEPRFDIADELFKMFYRLKLEQFRSYDPIINFGPEEHYYRSVVTLYDEKYNIIFMRLLLNHLESYRTVDGN